MTDKDMLDIAAKELRYECDTCRAKPGAPTLCKSCLTKRELAEDIEKHLRPEDDEYVLREKGEDEDSDGCCVFCGRYAKTRLIELQSRSDWWDGKRQLLCRLCCTTTGVGNSLNPEYHEGNMHPPGKREVAEMFAEAAHFIVSELKGD